MLKIQSWEEGIMEDPSYGVIVLFLDLNDIIRGVRHSYSKDETLIKYSKEIHSPISSNPSDTIQLGGEVLHNVKAVAVIERIRFEWYVHSLFFRNLICMIPSSFLYLIFIVTSQRFNVSAQD